MRITKRDVMRLALILLLMFLSGILGARTGHRTLGLVGFCTFWVLGWFDVIWTGSR